MDDLQAKIIVREFIYCPCWHCAGQGVIEEAPTPWGSWIQSVCAYCEGRGFAFYDIIGSTLMLEDAIWPGIALPTFMSRVRIVDTAPKTLAV